MDSFLNRFHQLHAILLNLNFVFLEQICSGFWLSQETEQTIQLQKTYKALLNSECSPQFQLCR